jgi:hypothetical protein
LDNLDEFILLKSSILTIELRTGEESCLLPMENVNDQDDNPKNKNKKSHKRGKPTIKDLAKAKRVEEKAQKAAPKSRNRLPKCSNATGGPSDPAGNRQLSPACMRSIQPDPKLTTLKL